MARQRQTSILAIMALALSATASAQHDSVAIYTSRANEKVTFEMDSCPSGPIEMHVIVRYLGGESIRLPKHKTTCDLLTGRGVGPLLPPELDGFYFDLEIVDPATGRSICGTGGFVN